MSTWIALGALVAVVLLLGWRLGKERELFVVKVVDGRIVSARGHLPPALLGDLGDVLSGSGASGTVVARRSEGRAALQLRGSFSAAVAQRLRNVVGTVSLPKLLGTPRR